MKKEIDYVISTTKHIIKDIIVLNSFKISNDHRLVRANVIINLKRKQLKDQIRKTIIDHRKLNYSGEFYKAELTRNRRQAENKAVNDTLEVLTENLTTAIKKLHGK